MNKFFLTKGAFIFAITGYLATSGFAYVAKAPKDTSKLPLVVLIVSDSCGCCLNLQQEQFTQKFKEKYDGILTLKEYEIHTEEGAKQAQKYNINGTPNLFMGKAKIGQSCHAEEMLGAVDKALAKRKKRQASAAKRPQAPAIISITAETDELQGVAPQKDLAYMQKYIERVQDTNEQTIVSITPLFSNQMVTQAMAIITQNEKKLKNLAAKSPSYQAFKKQADQLETVKQQQLDQLIKTSSQPVQK